MHVAHLSLSNVRSFRRLDLDLTPGLHVVTGPNGSGKSNLLESIALIATARSLRTSNDVDIISWDALRDDPLPAARLAARVHSRAEDNALLEVIVSARAPGAEGQSPLATRRFRVNGIARRASDLIGRLRVVLFSAEDLNLVEGAPALRRRYLDITISQIDPTYVRALQRYQRVLQQRNSLLRRLQEHRGQLDELDFWDGELAQTGAQLLTTRARVLHALHGHAAARYEELSTRADGLEVMHQPAVPAEVAATLTASASEATAAFLDALRAARQRDVFAGTTRYGPHRDDVAILVGGHPAATAASRGEMRGIALALRLAEVRLSAEDTGDTPVLLLDDVLSELDAGRRARVLAAAFEVDQVLITSPDPDRPSRSELSAARRYSIHDGTLGLLEE